jgi:hypothetical protein
MERAYLRASEMTVTIKKLIAAVVLAIAPASAFWYGQSPSAPAPTVFDTANTGLGITQTNGNLTVTSNTNLNAYTNVHAISGVTSGRYFAEFTVNTGDGSVGNMEVGIVNPSAMLNGVFVGQAASRVRGMYSLAPTGR